MNSALIVALICSVGFVGAYFKLGSGAGEKTKKKIEETLKLFKDSNSALSQEIEKSKNLVSSKQIAAVQAQIESFEASIAQERAQLVKVETNLSKCQQDVEVRENAHQNQKIAKDDEEEKLNELMERHEALSAESIELERGLAESLKILDKMLSETEMTDNQRGLLKDLQSSTESAGARLRDLISEYEAVKSRVAMLRQQHQDLEEEYTRLVELQLG